MAEETNEQQQELEQTSAPAAEEAPKRRRTRTRKVAEAYINYLYSKEGQEIAAKHFYRPRDEEIAAKYGIRNIPTLLYFKDGELAERSVGLVPRADIESILNNLL